jgi:hypothetical protein
VLVLLGFNDATTAENTAEGESCFEDADAEVDSDAADFSEKGAEKQGGGH